MLSFFCGAALGIFFFISGVEIDAEFTPLGGIEAGGTSGSPPSKLPLSFSLSKPSVFVACLVNLKLAKDSFFAGGFLIIGDNI